LLALIAAAATPRLLLLPGFLIASLLEKNPRGIGPIPTESAPKKAAAENCGMKYYAVSCQLLLASGPL
jgi:hypothetical protein